jgi:hypothetical protein
MKACIYDILQDNRRHYGEKFCSLKIQETLEQQLFFEDFEEAYAMKLEMDRSRDEERR